MKERITLSQEKTSFETEHPDIGQNIKILKFVLLPLEYWCLKLLFLKEEPLSTGQIYNFHVVERERENKNSKKDIFVPNTIEGDYKVSQLNGQTLIIPVPRAKDIREIEKELREKKIKFHSYKFIKQTLEKLENWGILATREAEAKSKTDLFWIINPKFYLKYGKQIEGLLKEEKEKAQF